MRVRILGPDASDVSPADVRRLFKGRHMTAARRTRVAGSGQVVAVCGTRVVGLAAYECSDGEFRVHEVGVDEESVCCVDEIVGALIDALELACLAGGGRRLLLLPRAATGSELLRQRGYVQLGGGRAGTWFTKSFPS